VATADTPSAMSHCSAVQQLLQWHKKRKGRNMRLQKQLVPLRQSPASSDSGLGTTVGIIAAHQYCQDSGAV